MTEPPAQPGSSPGQPFAGASPSSGVGVPHQGLSIEDAPPADASLQRAQEVQAALDGICGGEPSPAQKAAMAMVATIIGNALAHPDVDKFRHVRRSNKAFAARVVPQPEVEVLLRLAGFVLGSDGVWSLGTRCDPAMLWLVHSMLQSCAASSSAQAA